MITEFQNDKYTCKFIKNKILQACPLVLIKHRPVRNRSNMLVLVITASEYREQDIVCDIIGNFEKELCAISQMLLVPDIFFWNKFRANK